MDHMAEHNTGLDRPEELRLSLEKLEKAVNATPAKGVPKPLFIAVAALAVVLGIFAAALCFFDSDYKRNLSLAHASYDHMCRERDEAQAGLAAAQEELSRTQDQLAQARAELDAAQDTIALLEEYSLAAPDGAVPEYTALCPDLYAPAWEGEAVTGGRVCCLTFDDGPSANTGRVLDILDRYGVKATFFVVGKTGEADQARMREIVNRGHAIGMHSWSHDYQKIYASVDAFLEEFDQLYRWIYEVTGVYPSVYRFPGGSLNGYDRGVYQEIIAEMTRRGFVYFDWNRMSGDAVRGNVPAETLVENALDRADSLRRVILLMHDSTRFTNVVEALPQIIEGYQEAGFSFAALTPEVKPVIYSYPE